MSIKEFQISYFVYFQTQNEFFGKSILHLIPGMFVSLLSIWPRLHTSHQRPKDRRALGAAPARPPPQRPTAKWRRNGGPNRTGGGGGQLGRETTLNL